MFTISLQTSSAELVASAFGIIAHRMLAAYQLSNEMERVQIFDVKSKRDNLNEYIHLKLVKW